MGEPRSSQTFSVQSHISVEILCPGCEAVSRWRMPPSLVSLHFIFLFLCWLPLSSSFISYCSIIQAVTTRWVLFLLRIRFHFIGISLSRILKDLFFSFLLSAILPSSTRSCWGSLIILSWLILYQPRPISCRSDPSYLLMRSYVASRGNWGGVAGLFASLLLLLVIPFLNKGSLKGNAFYPARKILHCAFFLRFLLLTVGGS